MKKGKIFFNLILFITILAFLSLIGYIAYYYISQYLALREAEKAVEEFENNVIVVAVEEEQNTQTEEPAPQTPAPPPTQNVSGSTIGTIKIPKTGVSAPIVNTITPQSFVASVVVLYGPGLNEIGNTVLAAHNYRNRNTFFK